MKRNARSGGQGHGPSQRQLRAAELVRHALVDVIAREDLRDPDLQGVSVTIGEVRASPDLKHMTVFVSSLGAHDGPRLAATRASMHGFIACSTRMSRPAPRAVFAATGRRVSWR